ncbi:hypothetical protein [Beggiatoa leptomitoformis]|uniref:Uncharacterized protein n=1 Tax=Beggiatoa leptomitoformis TaxID=288004 RepID=A0A2N9YIB0_9GAMM|nr:hypothetical protein [Beggiatoa leptomitoformis]ALG67529.1 hypothetical protein AL038_07205 [Beggiatoa leptomitoformis]AUI70247.1 hypothetical protein BLE401_17110 [Beggiatoa leptomitoformis]
MRYSQILIKLMNTCFILGLIILIYYAGCWGIADALTRQVRQEMRQWTKSPTHLTQDRWTIVQQKTQQLAFLTPNAPDLLELQAQLSHWQLRFVTYDSLSLYEDLQTQALNYFLQSVRTRPSSAYTWNNITLLKYYLRQYDKQFFQALDNTASLGKWEPLIQQDIVETGLINWHRLPASSQLTVIYMIERGLSMPFNQMSTLIQRYHRRATICQNRQSNTPLLASTCS